jgi:hypothetical protein
MEHIPFCDENIKTIEFECEEWLKNHPDPETRSILIRELMHGGNLVYQGGTAGRRAPDGRPGGKGGNIEFHPGKPNADGDPGGDIYFHDQQKRRVNVGELIDAVRYVQTVILAKEEV